MKVFSADDALDPNEVDDFYWDWTARLADGETIADYDVTVNGATLGTVTPDGALITARLTTTAIDGGTVQATCRITTSDGRVFDETLLIPVAEQ